MRFVDHYLKPHAEALPSYIKDTTDFINKTNGVQNITEDQFLVTLDVKSLFTNIPNHEGIKAAKEPLNSVPKKPIPTKIIKFLFLIITFNNFVFNGIHYFQKQGCAMRTIFAPTYANIFMAKFEKNFMYPCFQTLSNFYCRFIDNIFLLWNGSETHLLGFITRLNSRHPTIKFCSRYSKSSMEFLDTKMYKNKEKNRLLSAIYRKPTDRTNFLDPTSVHPSSLINSIPLIQALRNIEDILRNIRA